MNLPALITLTTVLPAALLLAWGWRLMSRADASRGWSVVNGTIRESQVVRQGNTRSPRIAFDYHVAAQPRVGRRLWVGPASISVSGNWADRVVARYPVGARVRVAVDPADPGYAVLEPGRQVMHWLPVAIAAVVAIAGAGVAVAMAVVMP